MATLRTTSCPIAQPYLDAIEEGLRELGWVAGRNVVLEHRFSDGHPERLPGLAAEVIAWKPDVVVAPLNTGALALKRLTTTMPIVFIVSYDPVAAGLAASLARPGGNATGMTGAGPETSAKRLQMLRELAPAARRVGVIWNAAFPGLQDMRKAVDDAAPGLGMTIVDHDPRVLRRQRVRLLRCEPARPVQAGRRFHRQDSPGCEPCCHPDRAADDLQLGDQPQDRQGSRRHHPAAAGAAGGPTN
ncbi:MAG: ABC transporter substrate-binding protein [Candidatus Rokubacteria bacterium]|nr:ABC transporter substrate-binding protein [Candidatus Rokubacteria bacterium]